MKRKIQEEKVIRPRLKLIDKVAIHEAGHAAFTLHYGIPFEFVTIIPHDRTLGAVVATKILNEADYIGGVSEDQEGIFNVDMMVLTAGAVAESKLKNKQFKIQEYHYLQPDFSKFYARTNLAISKSEKVYDAFQKYIILRATDLFDSNKVVWQTCLQVADALKKKTLTYSECQKIYLNYAC